MKYYRMGFEFNNYREKGLGWGAFTERKGTGKPATCCHDGGLVISWLECVPHSIKMIR